MSGPIIASIAAVLFGLSSPAAKALLGSIDPWILASLLYLGSGIGMSVVLLLGWVAKKQPVAKIPASDLPWLMGATLFGGIIGPVFLMYGLTHTPASSASLLLNLEGVLTAGLAWFVFGEHRDRRIVTGMIVIIAGGIILSWPSSIAWSGLIGPLLVSAACFCWAIDNNLTRKISLNDPVLLTLVKSLIAGVTNLGLALGLGEQIPSLGLSMEAGGLGFLCYGLSIVCFILSLRHMGASRTGAYFSSAPFVGVLVAVFFWHEPVTLRLLVAASLMGYGIYLHLSESHSHEHTHEEFEHEHSHAHDKHHRHEHGPLHPPSEPHTHRHMHSRLTHTHRHFPDMHHTHGHGR